MDIGINKDEEKRWLHLAESDYSFAVFVKNSDYKPAPYDKICYNCQQSAEKAVKSLIIHLGRRGGLPKSHSVSFLLNQISGILKDELKIEIPPYIKTAADSLEKTDVESRYPIYRDITEGEAESALECA